MRRRTLLLAVGLYAFFTGASLDYYLRRPGPIPDCFCTSARRRLVSTAEQTLASAAHPLEILGMLRTARRRD